MAEALEVEDTVTIEMSRPELEALLASVDEAIMQTQDAYGEDFGDTPDEVCTNLRGLSDELDRCLDARQALIDALEVFE